MREWYVLHVLTGKEADTKEVITRDMPELSPLVIEERIVIVPQRKLIERSNGKWKEVIRTCFPGYVFINAEMTTSLYYKLTKIPSVIRILGNNGPQPVPLDEMKMILWMVPDNKSDILDISEGMQIGNQIIITRGPLKGLEGSIIKVDARRRRAKVGIVLMGQQRTVELGIDLLKSEGASC